ncbi:MAG: DNA translocase FtsK 4TM domain-containing protein, partial [Betaproteobacteria bacterium]|nr:DNA translocase FtsK 4TM domain-containing protein [Betaproteobacteria bacterium]
MSSSTMPAKLARLLREALLGLVALAALYLAMVLVTYHRSDPGWSVGAASRGVANAGGRFGAWTSDLLLYLFGFSAAWFVLALMLAAWRGYRAVVAEREQSLGIQQPGRQRHWVLAMTGGFWLLLLSSASIEAMRFAGARFELPLHPSGPGACSGAGGVVGCELADFLATSFGVSGALMLLVTSAAIGFSLLTGTSWIQVAEWVGAQAERATLGALERTRAWQDRRVGRKAEVAREAVVVEARKQLDTQAPLVIAPPPPQIVPSARAVKEKQVPLFLDLPDSDLPPLSLLDMAEIQGETLSPETLEFTSRLIERKLADFNVEVKVLAAYPGPVITRYEIEPAVGVKGSQIVNLVKDLARALSVGSIRVVESIPGKSCMGLEIPNPRREVVRLSEIIGSAVYGDMGSPLALALGKDIAGNPVVVDLARMPHLLVAGTTGSGKSV